MIEALKGLKADMLSNPIQYIGFGMTLGIFISQLARKSAPKSTKTEEHTEEEKRQSQASDCKSDPNKQPLRKVKDKLKKSNIQQKIIQKTKKNFQTDIEAENQKVPTYKSIARSERNNNDKLFFQLYSKVAQEESGEDS